MVLVFYLYTVFRKYFQASIIFANVTEDIFYLKRSNDDDDDD